MIKKILVGVVAGLLLLAPMAPLQAADVFSNQSSVNVSLSTTESITLAATPGSITFNGLTASGPITVTTNYTLQTTRNLYLTAFLTPGGSYITAYGPGAVNLAYDGGSSQPCNFTASVANYPMNTGVPGGTDGYYCSDTLIAGASVIAANSGVGSTSDTVNVGVTNAAVPGVPLAFVLSFEADAH